MAVMDAADVLIHPSSVDAFPTTLIEAGAAGVPVLSTMVGGIPEIVLDGESGVLIDPPPRSAGFARELERLLSDAELRRRLGQGGRRRYEEEFTAARWAGRLRLLYEEVLATYHGADERRVAA